MRGKVFFVVRNELFGLLAGPQVPAVVVHHHALAELVDIFFHLLTGFLTVLPVDGRTHRDSFLHGAIEIPGQVLGDGLSLDGFQGLKLILRLVSRFGLFVGFPEADQRVAFGVFGLGEGHQRQKD